MFSVVAPVMQGWLVLSDHRPMQSVSQNSMNLLASSACSAFWLTMNAWSTCTFSTGSLPESSVGQRKKPYSKSLPAMAFSMEPMSQVP